VDCFLLAEVYVNLLGGRQSDLSFDSEEIVRNESSTTSAVCRNKRQPRNFPASEEELEAHRAFITAAGLSMWHDSDQTLAKNIRD
jgi:DNA polymerase-3 subunit epsilon